MTDPTTARLRQAAGVVRKHLANPKLTDGPWISLDGGDRIIRNQPGDENWSPVYVVDEPMSNGANAAWIALMHPVVGEALARLLETEAASNAGDEDHAGCTTATCATVAAVALADAILGPVTP